MRLRDRAFQRTFSKLFVYNILFEDAEQDEQWLEVGEDSTILAITGAGCGVAGLLTKRPRSIDAADINRHHLALAALKMAGAQHLRPYSVFYDLLGRGWSPTPKQTLEALAPHLPPWVQRYWRKHHKRFSRSLYLEGMTSRMLTAVRALTGLDSSWLRRMVDAPVEDRFREIDEQVAPIARTRLVTAMLKSPLQLIALGINFNQRDKILETQQQDIVDYFISHLKKVAATDLEKNWFAWHAMAGGFNHDHPDAVPPYLRRSRWETSIDAPTEVRLLNGNIFDRLAAAGPDTWSHYMFCDAPDWLPDYLQRRLLDEVFRTSRDGGVMLARSVEHGSWVDDIDGGKRFQLMQEASDTASREDRSRQYERVNYYRIVH